MWEWLPENERGVTFFCTTLVVCLLVLFLAMVDCTKDVEIARHQYIPPACPEDAVVAHDGNCITVDDADFRDGYWYPKR